jgi:hypothetical protein
VVVGCTVEVDMGQEDMVSAREDMVPAPEDIAHIAQEEDMEPEWVDMAMENKIVKIFHLQ